MKSPGPTIKLAVISAILLCGCRYEFGYPDEFGNQAIDGGTSPDATRALPDAQAMDNQGFCPPVPDLVACFTFEGDTDDSSMYGNHAAATDASYTDGMVAMALLADMTTEVIIDDDPSLHYPPDQMTMEAWVRADSIPPFDADNDPRLGVVDQDLGPSIFIYDGGDVRCHDGGRRIATGPGFVEPGVWTHLACTYYMGTTTIYVDGRAVRVEPNGTGVSPGMIGMAIAGNSPSGDPLIGAIDSLRIWHVARTDQDICDAAGVPCP